MAACHPERLRDDNASVVTSVPGGGTRLNLTRTQVVLGLSALVALVFHPVRGFFFAQDDFGWLRLARFRWTDIHSVLTQYHGSFTPVANLAVAAVYRLFGLA